jgi:hypothetical protein
MDNQSYPPPNQGQGYMTPQNQQQGYTPPPQPGYMPPQQPMYSSYMQDNNAPLTLGQYMMMFLIMMIPIANIIMPFVWAFGNSNVNKKNFARAMLIWMAIAIVLSIVLSSVIAGIISSAVRGY